MKYNLIFKGTCFIKSLTDNQLMNTDDQDVLKSECNRHF